MYPLIQLSQSLFSKPLSSHLLKSELPNPDCPFINLARSTKNFRLKDLRDAWIHVRDETDASGHRVQGRRKCRVFQLGSTVVGARDLV